MAGSVNKEGGRPFSRYSLENMAQVRSWEYDEEWFYVQCKQQRGPVPLQELYAPCQDNNESCVYS